MTLKRLSMGAPRLSEPDCPDPDLLFDLLANLEPFRWKYSLLGVTAKFSYKKKARR